MAQSSSTPQTNIIIAFASVTSAFIGFLVATILFLFKQPSNPSQPLVLPAPTPSPTTLLKENDCLIESEINNLQSCCANWAKENKIDQPLCSGEWQIIDGQCSWVCRSR